MDSGYNKCVFVGYVASEFDEAEMNSGKPMVSFTLEVTKSHHDTSGQRHENTAWIPITGYARIADHILDSTMRKGDRILVEGEFRCRTNYVNGQSYMIHDIVCHHIVPMTAKSARDHDLREVPTTRAADVINDQVGLDARARQTLNYLRRNRRDG